MTLEFKIIEQILSEIMSLGLKSIVHMLPERVLLWINVSKYLP